MKKIPTILIIGILLISGLGVTALPSSEVKQEIKNVSFSQLSMYEKGEYITLSLEGADSVFMKKDHYMIPMHIETFTYPFGTEIINVQCIPKNIQRQTNTKELMLTPDPIIIGQTDMKIQSDKSNIGRYKSPNTWYNYDIGTGIIGNELSVIVKIQILPVQYDPLRNIIDWAKTVEIDIEYKEPEEPINFNDEYTLIVLAPADFSEELTDLITHKNNIGISTKLVTLDEIYSSVYFPAEGRDDQEKVKYFIKNAFENWSTNYVLLVGGSMKFPVRTTHIHIDATPPDDELFVSDLYYADIYNDTGGFSSWDTNENNIFGEFNWGGSRLTDEVDLYPDVYLGRLACVNENEVTTCVDKIVTYETNKAHTKNWFNNLVVVGGDSFPGDTNTIDEGEYVNEAVIAIMDGFIPDKVWATNGRLSGLVPTGVAEINSAINEGVGFVDFSGHGNTKVWATHPHEGGHSEWLPTPYGHYSNSNIANLQNGDELPIVVTGACSISKFDQTSDCFSWSFVSNPNGGGIGSFGASGLGWAYIGEDVTEGLIEGIAIKTFEAFKDEGAKTFGEMWGKAITNYISPGMEGTDYKTVEEWQPFGDPTLVIAEESQIPEKPENLDGKTSGKVNVEYTYTASTTDPDAGDKLFYLFEWGDEEYSGWIGPYNQGETAEASHKWQEEGDYQIRVKAKDNHGVQSEWSDPLDISMPKNKGLFKSILFTLLERLLERFPFLSEILTNRPILSRLLDL